MPAAISIRHFTDPACPYAWSAEPYLRRLEWRYGDALSWDTRMVVLSTVPEDYVRRNVTLEAEAAGRRRLAASHGMPMDATPRARHLGTIVACRAAVAARREAPDRMLALVRRFRVWTLLGLGFTDEPSVVAACAEEVGMDPAELARWTADPVTESDLGHDMAAARAPSTASLRQARHLAPAGEGWRYSCPSLEITAGEGRIDVPGFQPGDSYDVALANLAPDIEPRPAPTDPLAVLRWAPFPLATAEVAAVMGTGRDAAREALATAGATEEPAGGDAFWRAA